jgi:hypothetical protein
LTEVQTRINNHFIEEGFSDGILGGSLVVPVTFSLRGTFQPWNSRHSPCLFRSTSTPTPASKPMSGRFGFGWMRSSEYFKVRTTDGKRYILSYNEHEEGWTLQSGFDGADLLVRPGIEVVAVEPSAIRQAESKIAECERCRGDEADHPFDFILADILSKHGAFDFILSEPAHCPNCKGDQRKDPRRAAGRNRS